MKDHDDGERPSKKQKTDDAQGKSGNDITLLVTVPEHNAIVFVAEDKSLIVLAINQDAVIEENSRRAMPKRVSALQVIIASETILCADKFGDVYALPLFPDRQWRYANDKAAAKEQAEKERLFKPSATELTVHSVRNRKALESQQKQKKFTPRKSPLAFEHKLILGHVSMLTDMVYAQPGAALSAHRIITADRDEHIRVSRTLPQAHIIGGFCLGHAQFISKLCLLKDSSLLVSGGGDDWLGLWDYTTYGLQCKIDMRAELAKHTALNITPEDKLSISVLWERPRRSLEDDRIILAVCEKVPSIMVVRLDQSSTIAPTVQVVETGSNPISFAVLAADQLVVSFDARDSLQPRLASFTVMRNGSGSILQADQEASVALAQLNAIATFTADPAALDSSLYSTANLRKRRGWGDPGEDSE